MLLLLAGFLFILIFTLSPSFISWISESKDMGNAMTEFLTFRSWGLFFAALQASLFAFFIGLGRTKIIISATLLMAVTNISLDYGLIFGQLGLPELGMKGAAIASSVSEMLTFLFLFSVASKTKRFRKYHYHLRNKHYKLDQLHITYRSSIPHDRF